MDLFQTEARLGLTLPERHRLAIANPTDPIHEACDFLVPDSPYELLQLVHVNEVLHAADRWNRWPTFLIAFASNGCGDYFAYNTRFDPPRIIYLVPDRTVDENLSDQDRLEFDTFETWYEARLEDW